MDPDQISEQWRVVTVAGTQLLASSLGRIKDSAGTVLVPGRSAQNLLCVRFRDKDGVEVARTVEVLVCTAFHGEPSEQRLRVRHVNRRNDDNRASNLVWPVFRNMPVTQLTLENERIATYWCAHAAVVAVRTPRSATITNCCRGLSKTAGGYKWRFATLEEADGVMPVVPPDRASASISQANRRRKREAALDSCSSSAPAPHDRAAELEHEAHPLDHLL
jgi:hypothetical protein